MDLKEKVAISDETLIRLLTTLYGVARDRGIDINDVQSAGALLTGALRLSVAIAKAHGMDLKALKGLVADAMETRLEVVSHDDPAVRRWTETFKQTWGVNVPFSALGAMGGGTLH